MSAQGQKWLILLWIFFTLYLYWLFLCFLFFFMSSFTFYDPVFYIVCAREMPPVVPVYNKNRGHSEFRFFFWMPLIVFIHNVSVLNYPVLIKFLTLFHRQKKCFGRSLFMVICWYFTIWGDTELLPTALSTVALLLLVFCYVFILCLSADWSQINVFQSSSVSAGDESYKRTFVTWVCHVMSEKSVATGSFLSIFT